MIHEYLKITSSENNYSKPISLQTEKHAS